MTTRTGRESGPNPPGDSAAARVAPRIVFIAAAAALGGFLFGYDSAVINGAVTGIQHDFNVGSGTTGFVVAAALPGAAAGAIAGGWMADRIGRIRAMQIAAVLFIISGIGSMFAFQPWDLTIWRILGGFAIGIASVIGPAYIAEVSPPAFRGRLTSFQQLAIVLGIAISALVNYLINQWAGGTNTDHLGGLAAWRWMLGAEVIPAILYGVLSTMIPESPRFLVANGEDDRAREVLAEVEGTHANVADRIAEIRDQLAGEVKPKLADLLTPSRKNLLAVVWIGIGLSVLQQFVGINVIFYYSSLLWQSVGIDTSNSLLISMISAAVNIAGTVVAMALVDRIGRRPLLLIGSVGMAVTLGLCAWMFSYGTHANGKTTLPKAQGVTALLGANAYVFFFAMSWGVVVWVLLGEMFPNRIRAVALSVAASAQWLANWLVTVSFPSLSRWSLAGAYSLYAIAAAVSIPFVYYLVRETKGKTLESMG
ncbi:sugar transporter [Catenulispora acidiphila DSM 44928]|uniref:Sugar transporter n=1 Tax=Catenulispora acidiphila (strain DSM 44928 / JCM 14897 / NBRC 102108 / NRRL B-24433 / ID139908) TaxID=479433 RepID=C7PVB1_CATAD|nr:sugar porter family MFS transporter [Catenulispora acidiphila]ACU69267.1 sugar transporter [Catenulispora acidiphila DSM 44928]